MDRMVRMPEYEVVQPQRASLSFWQYVGVVVVAAIVAALVSAVVIGFAMGVRPGGPDLPFSDQPEWGAPGPYDHELEPPDEFFDDFERAEFFEAEHVAGAVSKMLTAHRAATGSTSEGSLQEAFDGNVPPPLAGPFEHFDADDITVTNDPDGAPMVEITGTFPDGRNWSLTWFPGGGVSKSIG
jgi:hypothetical protein